MAQPLEGLRILEVGGGVAAAAAGKTFSDFGATVTKVEPLEGGETRRTPPFPNDRPHLDTGAFHLALDTGKRSIVLDTTTASGREVLGRLFAQSDVAFVERPAAEAKRLAALAGEGGPTVITITPHGLEGPYADRVENDTSVFAWTTRMQLHAIAPRPPLRYAPYVPSIQVGTTASAAALAAIWSREHAGPRRDIEVTAVEALAGNVDSFFVTWAFSGAEMPRLGGQSQAAYVAGAYACKDGHLVFASAGNPFFSRLCEGIGHAELAVDPRFNDPLQKPQHWSDFMEYLQPWLNERTRNEVFTHLQSYGVMVAPILTVAELLEDAQAVARGAFVDVKQPLVGETTIAGPPFHLDGGWLAKPSPRLGEHTADILEKLGYTAAERVALFKAGVAT